MSKTIGKVSATVVSYNAKDERCPGFVTICTQFAGDEFMCVSEENGFSLYGYVPDQARELARLLIEGADQAEQKKAPATLDELHEMEAQLETRLEKAESEVAALIERLDHQEFELAECVREHPNNRMARLGRLHDGPAGGE